MCFTFQTLSLSLSLSLSLCSCFICDIYVFVFVTICILYTSEYTCIHGYACGDIKKGFISLSTLRSSKIRTVRNPEWLPVEMPRSCLHSLNHTQLLYLGAVSLRQFCVLGLYYVVSCPILHNDVS